MSLFFSILDRQISVMEIDSSNKKRDCSSKFIVLIFIINLINIQNLYKLFGLKFCPGTHFPANLIITTDTYAVF